MTSPDQLPSIRIHPENANHHLWNNHGTWFLHYTIHPTPVTKERIRRSLGTKDLAVARRRRNACFARLMISGKGVMTRIFPPGGDRGEAPAKRGGIAPP